jgi:hypothetical protein
MRLTASRLLPVLLIVFAARAERVEAQQRVALASPKAEVRRDTVTYSSDPADFVVGKRVYLRSTKTYIGTIVEFDRSKSFGPKFPRRYMQAVLIARAEDRKDWVPIPGITRIYVTR